MISWHGESPASFRPLAFGWSGSVVEHKKRISSVGYDKKCAEVKEGEHWARGCEHRRSSHRCGRGACRPRSIAIADSSSPSPSSHCILLLSDLGSRRYCLAPACLILCSLPAKLDTHANTIPLHRSYACISDVFAQRVPDQFPSPQVFDELTKI